MVNVRARQGEIQVQVSIEAGCFILEALRGTPLEVRSGCNGNGSCGICQVRVVQGHMSPPSLPEMLQIPKAELDKGRRLACQARILGDVELELISGRETVGWKLLPREEDRLDLTRKTALGRSYTSALCIDIGTSRLRLSLTDLGSHARLAGASGPNPLPGSDVISRLDAASLGEGEEESYQLRQAIAEGLSFLHVVAGVDLNAVRKIIVVGNSAMQSLLRGTGHALILDPASWSKRAPRDTILLPDFGRDIGLGDVEAEVIPPLGGFIGSDLLAGMLACDLDGGETSLLVDFGANTEIALWTGEKMMAVSVAGGPAFEGWGIGCGMAAYPGAVFRVQALGDGKVDLGIIGGGPPSGLCGSGLVDTLALFVGRGMVDEVGRIQGETAIIDPNWGLHLTKADIDVLQRAKAAVAASIMYLLQKAGIGADRIVKVYVAGTLGRYLDIPNAVYIGLLPPLPVSRFEQIENAALLGAELCALDDKKRARLEAWGASTEMHNLAAAPGFEDLFIDSLHLRPWPGRTIYSSFRDLGRPEENFVRAAQYISDMRLEGDNQEKLGMMIARLFDADLIAFVEHRDDILVLREIDNRSLACRSCPHEELILREARVVMESGFASTIGPTPDRVSSIALLPMQVEERTVVMVIGHDIPEQMPRQRLDGYLALSKSAGGILTRLEQERELIGHRTRLSKLVEERTMQVEEVNAKLRQEVEMRARDEEAIRLANNKLNLLSSMTRHDIINQVTAVLGYVHLMETKGLPPEKMMRYLGKIESITATIQRLIEFTRDYQDLGVHGPTWQQIDEDFWRAAASFRDSGLTFTSGTEGLEIFSDQMLNKVFHNLIDNTIRHGGGARQASLSYVMDGEELLLHYRDDGVGISPDQKALIFERGFGKNTGLGLFLVREILSITGIRIVEVGTPGNGADFAMHVPKGSFRLRSGKG
ncbi:MAG: ASKHA domain-containing protein [Methanomassiliicoccales archaeon]